MARPDVADILKHFGVGGDPKTLLHYGVVGMKWGKTKAVIPASADAERASALKVRAKQGGPKSLSNQELQTLVTRLNLEQQYTRLNPKQKSEGLDFAKQALKIVGPLAIDLAGDSMGPYGSVAKMIVTEVTKDPKKKK